MLKLGSALLSLSLLSDHLFYCVIGSFIAEYSILRHIGFCHIDFAWPKVTYCTILFFAVSEKASIETDRRLVIARELGVGTGVTSD